MLTSEKIEIYKKYKGYYDGYYIQNKGKEKLISDDEWFLLSNLVQDIYLIRNGVAAKSFEKKITDELTKNCDSKITYDLVFELEKYINEENPI
ncbi:hypothetical protein [Flavobacterium collinsii]|uniref:Uncharacterized protein n=1 Tax=Flavobacterium collinsii TaxID=1114861 RepID=A0A9W4X5B4_9FLAO|nr:hypothetical protein [Flavobacterium collinsii]CAA9196470.1 hypothetical protein FLACOL7796_01186 [Flavobacterium collinsii]CAI2765854.1 conserved protein of unknown function [Flavobacterium collinsii]